MTNIAQQSLHFELSESSSNNCFKDIISKGFVPYTNYLNSLKKEFEEEVEKNLQEFNSYPLAYKYIMEALFKFECLKKYYFASIFTNRFFKNCCKKALILIDDSIRDIVNFIKNTNSMICDFLLLKSNLLKQLKEEYFKRAVVKSSNLKWNKNVIDIIEVAELMKETGMVKGINGKVTLKELVGDLAAVFGVEVKNLYSKVSKAKQRKKLNKPVIYQVMEDYIRDY